jgi:hypothetical protein
VSIVTAPAPQSIRSTPFRTSLAFLACVAAALSVAIALPPTAANAATTRSVNQCNGIGATSKGATTGLTCTVTVVNTIRGAHRGSTTTLKRTCRLGPCPGGNGTFITRSTRLVTSVTQCNGSANDAAPPLVTCRVIIINNISAGTPRARPVTRATVNQCVGTGTGGGKYGSTGPRVCNPYPATTTGATVTQCNGSATGGGSTAICSVSSSSRVSPAIPVRVNQCNGTGNKGGTLLRCSTRITTRITARVIPGSTSSATPNAQIPQAPTGGVAAGQGGGEGPARLPLLALGSVLIGAGFTTLMRLRVRRAG